MTNTEGRPARVTDHIVINRAHWDNGADAWVSAGEKAWSAGEPYWGIWEIPESELEMLPADMSSMSAIELGCGTAYVSAWMARRGAKVVGIDVSERQLATARRLQSDHGLAFPLIHADAERVPLPDGRFDFAISEYGAALWADPHAWIPEAHRLLRPGGELVFLSSSPLAMICYPTDGSGPVTETMQREYFGLYRIDWSGVEVDPGGVEFGLTVSGWFRLLRDSGFEILDYIEVQAPFSGPETRFAISADWANRYPSEHVWKARKR